MSLDGGPQPALVVPLDYPCSTLFVAETGGAASGGAFFVIAAVKVRNVGRLRRQVLHTRDRHDDDGELTLAAVTPARVPFFRDVIDALSASDARISATVVDLRAGGADPFVRDEPRWVGTARLTARLLHGSLVRRELATALIHQVTTPPDDAFEETVRRMTNTRLGSTSLVSALCADPRSSDGLQLADLVAAAIAYQRRWADGSGGSPDRADLAARLADGFAVADFRTDRRTDRVNVMRSGDTGATAREPINLTFVRRRS
jgi:hypothetical protein